METLKTLGLIAAMGGVCFLLGAAVLGGALMATTAGKVLALPVGAALMVVVAKVAQ